MSRSKDFAELAGAGVDSTEFAKLDGVTASTVELNKLDGVTATTAELNVLAGGITSLGAVTSGSLSSNVDIKSAIGASGSAPIYALRASGAIDTEGGTAYGLQNLSHTVDTSASLHTFTFTTAPSTAFYTVVAAGHRVDGYNELAAVTSKLAASFTVTTFNVDGNLTERGCDVSVFF